MTTNVSRSRRPGRSGVWLTALVAGLALGLAVGFTGPAAAGGLTKPKVRALVAKVLAKEAPKLSVARAATADRAATAERAATADHAASAQDAERLAGQDPSAYLDRVAYAAGVSGFTLAGMAQVIAGPVTLSVPEGVEYVRVSAVAGIQSLEFKSAYLHVAQAQNCDVAGVPTTPVAYAAADYPVENASLDYVLPVEPGERSFVLCGRSDGPSKAWGPTLVVETVALGASS